MNRPKLKIKKTALQKAIELLPFLLILGSAVLIGLYYPHLPEKLPIHFNWPSKDENGLGTKDVLWASPLICGVIAMGIYQLNKYPWIFNYPVEINEKNADYNYRQATQLLRLLNLVIGTLCVYVTMWSLLDARGIQNNLGNYVGAFFPLLLIGLPLLYVIKISIKK